ncbi:MAG: BACON domain-containing protein [Bacteroidales bacterium]|nr:BACON domain-containing protein [Bacteroidales bacterium]
MKKILILLSLALLAFACEQQKPEEEYSLKVDPLEVNIDKDGGSVTVAVESNGKWAVTSTDNWITIDPAEGEGNATVTLSAGKNDTEKARKGAVSVNGPSKKYTVTVKQEVSRPEGPDAPVKITEIKTADDFVAFGKAMDSYESTETVKLAADITVNAPVAFLACNFDGQDHTITFNYEENTAYTDADPTTQCLGLFRKVGGTVDGNKLSVSVKNLKTAGSIKTAPEDNSGTEYTYYIGGIAGYADGDARFENCVNGISLEATSFNTQHMGGIIGHACEDVVLVNCQNKASVAVSRAGKESKASQLGGICGHCATKASITGCVNDGEISYTAAGTCRMGGIVGYTNNVTTALYKDCVNNGSVRNDATGYTGTSWAYVGGITGYFGTPGDACQVVYENCTNNGSISSDTGENKLRTRVAGIAALAGKGEGGLFTYKNCTNNGAISQTKGSNSSTRAQLAGIVAYCETVAAVAIDGCVNSGTITTDAAGVKYVGVGAMIGGGGDVKSTITNVTVNASTVITCVAGTAAGLIGGSVSAFNTSISGKVAGTIVSGDTTTVADGGNFGSMLFGMPLGDGSSIGGVSFAQ